MINSESATAYLLNKKLRTVSAMMVKDSGTTGSYIKLITLSPAEEFLNGISMNGKFYILTVPKFKNELKVYTLVNGSITETVNYTIEMPSFDAKLSTENEYLNRAPESEVGMEEIHYSPENNIKSSFPEKKFYYQNNMIFFTFDEPACTHLIELDPISHRVTYRKINFSLEKGNNARSKQGNSFLYDNRLFRGTISPDQMNLSILDLDSMKLINSYNFYPETDIEISNGPILQEGGSGYGVDNERILKRPEQYFRKVLNGNFGVAANKIDSGKYEVQIGSYEEIVTTRGGNYGGYGSPGISIGIGMGGSIGVGVGGGGFGYPSMYSGGYGYPGSYYGGFPGYYSNSNSGSTTRVQVVYFKTLLNKEDFKHLEGEVPKSLRESIYDYEKVKFKNSPPDNIRITPVNDKLLLGYYLRSKKKYSMVEFKKR
jgi:hypothetical protein